MMAGMRPPLRILRAPLRRVWVRGEALSASDFMSVVSAGDQFSWFARP
jgi:hypothetical protein